ncbi:peptidoglycan recognition protein family protein [Rhodovulum sp. DZ06]|uniref:peptidoglycan recognition protein family protein n=1 Tax=Rhodovulum sp. DZ06 TaxID=3425126 RepID=UPI003D356189
MTQDILHRLAALEAAVSGQGRAPLPPGLPVPAGAPRPGVEISADGARATGTGGLVIEWGADPSCPYGRSATRGREPFAAVVIHHTGPAHDIDWYVQYQIDGDPGRGGRHFGYHFYVSPTGRVVQGAPLTKRTNHVKPSGHAMRRAFGRQARNQNAIGVSCVGAGKARFSPTPVQEETARALAAALCAAFGIDEGAVYGHGEIQSDRDPTEGASVARAVRDGLGAGGPGDGAHGEVPGHDADDDLDDGPIAAMAPGAGPRDAPGLEAAWGEESAWGPEGAWGEEGAGAARSVPAAFGPGRSADGAAPAAATTRLRYTNQRAIRNRPCTPNLERRILEAVEAVHGPSCTVNIYSGGQDRKGRGPRRTGSVRHDDFGQGGRAADVHVFDAGGRQVQGLELAELGQYWLARGYGCVGHQMRGGGIHLDEWTVPPPGGGLYWTYAASDGAPWAAAARRMFARGAQGLYP